MIRSSICAMLVTAGCSSSNPNAPKDAASDAPADAPGTNPHMLWLSNGATEVQVKLVDTEPPLF